MNSLVKAKALDILAVVIIFLSSLFAFFGFIFQYRFPEIAHALTYTFALLALPSVLAFVRLAFRYPQLSVIGQIFKKNRLIFLVLTVLPIIIIFAMLDYIVEINK